MPKEREQPRLSEYPIWRYAEPIRFEDELQRLPKNIWSAALVSVPKLEAIILLSFKNDA
jgi:hypothetical protein